MSTSVGITCAHCGQEIGEQYRMDDGRAYELFMAHLPECTGKKEEME